MHGQKYIKISKLVLYVFQQSRWTDRTIVLWQKPFHQIQIWKGWEGLIKINKSELNRKVLQQYIKIPRMGSATLVMQNNDLTLNKVTYLEFLEPTFNTQKY